MLGGTQLFATRHTFTRPCKMVGYLRFENMYGRVNISAGREMLSTAPYERLGAPPRRQPRAGRVHADTLPSVQQRAATVFPRRRERGWDPERRTARAPAVDPEINPSTRFLPNALRSAATMVGATATLGDVVQAMNTAAPPGSTRPTRLSAAALL